PPLTHTLFLHDALPISSGRPELRGGRDLLTEENERRPVVRMLKGRRVQYLELRVADGRSNRPAARDSAMERHHQHGRTRRLDSRSEEHTSELQSPYDLV